MTRASVMAARDPWGFRPLCIGRLGQGWVFASETCALAQTGAEYVRDVEPGELVTADAGGLHSNAFAEKGEQALAHCVFELVYFARPDSTLFGRGVHQVRYEYGQRLAHEHPAQADIVVPIPDSGSSAALGYSRGSGIPLDYGFIRNHYVGRTFLMPETGARYAGADIKLAVVPEVVRGRRVVVVDDSIVRGTTVRGRIARLRAAGAREIHVRISCPPTAHPCHYGIDFPTREELVAGNRDSEEVRRLIGADSLGYLSVEGLLSPFPNPGDFCTACFTGDYRVDPEGPAGKRELEHNRPEVRLA
jgi:amidophosphoribosyltransferase